MGERKYMKLLYPLGDGCFTSGHPKNFKYLKDKIGSHLIFKGMTCYSKIYPINKDMIFPPLALFNGILKKEFLNGNFVSEILPFEDKRCNLVGNMDIRVRNLKTGFSYAHTLFRHGKELFNLDNMKRRFDYFEENKNNFIYTIDFSRPGYRSFGNKWILKFEEYLIQTKMNLDQFYYLCPKNNVSDIFENTKIKLIECPNESLYVCNHINLPCCCCYFYKNYKEELLQKLNS